MEITASCPRCDFSRSVQRQLLYKKAQCPRCKTIFIVGGKNNKEGEKRTAKRYACERVTLHLSVVGDFDVQDLSTTGVGFRDNESDWDFSVGKKVYFDLYENNALVMEKIQVKVARYNGRTVGATLSGLTDNQRETLDAMMQRQELAASPDIQMDDEIHFHQKGNRMTLQGGKEIQLVMRGD